MTICDPVSVCLLNAICVPVRRPDRDGRMLIQRSNIIGRLHAVGRLRLSERQSAPPWLLLRRGRGGSRRVDQAVQLNCSEVLLLPERFGDHPCQCYFPSSLSPYLLLRRIRLRSILLRSSTTTQAETTLQCKGGQARGRDDANHRDLVQLAEDGTRARVAVTSPQGKGPFRRDPVHALGTRKQGRVSVRGGGNGQARRNLPS